MKNIKTSLVINILNIAFVIFAFFAMVFDFNFMSENATLSSPSFEALKYFTVDSNILLGIVSIPLAIEEILILKGKKEEISKVNLILKHMGTVGVSLTFFTVIFFLCPIFPNGYITMFLNCNLFMHLIVPVLSIVSLIFFERNNKLNIKHTFVGMIPMIIYAIYYVAITLTHVNEDGSIMQGYDWYQFLGGNVKMAFVAIPIMVCSTYLISYLLYRFNKEKISKK